MKLKHQMQEDVTTKPEKGGGKRYVEDKRSKSIEEMYQRMLMLGELEKAATHKNQTHGDKTEVIRMLDAAKKPPMYMEQSEIDQLQKKIDETKEKLSNFDPNEAEYQNTKKEVEQLRKELDKKQIKKEKEILKEALNGE